jgi:pseudouridine-5'-phosphate glycosidase
VDYRLDSAADIALALHTKWALGLEGGMVIANPIPEAYAMPKEAIAQAVETALNEADAQGIVGKESTPFLLARVCELTGGDSLASNIQLVLNNAALAAQVGKALQNL